MVAACHYLAAEAGFRILEAGGNAIDAGVAAGITLSVVQPEYVNFAGVAPIILYSVTENRVITISGLGTWPKSLKADFFQKHHGGKNSAGGFWAGGPPRPHPRITAPFPWGPIKFGEEEGAAIEFARDGFAVYPLMSQIISEHADEYRMYPSNSVLYLPKGRPPLPGEIFVQSDLASTMQFMVDEERATRGRSGREAGLRAARDAFYRGEISRRIVDFQKEHGGLLSSEDLAEYRSGIEEPVAASFGDMTLYSCGPWCQGPSLLQALNLLDAAELEKAGHNSVEYLHLITEAVKLAFADREVYFGDPRMVDVPIDALLSEEYTLRRRDMIDRVRAWPGMPPAGDPTPLGTKRSNRILRPERAWQAPEIDTSYVCVVDRHGNAFSATPSDNSYTAPVVPGLGIIPSCRGSQNWADPSHVSGVAPGKRPRLTPSPALAFQRGKMVMPFGTPGGDVQTQAMLQVFLNINLFGLDVQEAVESPRVASYSFPSSFEPHAYHPGQLNLEGHIEKSVGEGLERLGHKIEWWPEWAWQAGAVCTILADKKTGVLKGGADPRRPSYVVGL